LWAGNLGSALLTSTYYPQKNTSAGEIAATFGTSLGGAAIGFLTDEFIDDALVLVHLKKGE
jgi:hypothetical protein